MKKILIMIIIWLALLSTTYAANSNWDCLLILSKDSILAKWDEGNLLTGLITAMPKEAMEVAFENLNKYCCDAKIISSNCSDTNDNTLYPESIYIFDHILDVYMRILDAKVNNENWGDLLYNLTADESWLNWRKFITDQGNDENWTKPSEIKKEYDEYRKSTKNIASFNNNDRETKETWNNSIKTYIIWYTGWTLLDKYNLACDLVNYISENKPISGKWLTQNEYQSCKKLTKSRVDREYTYVQTLLMQKANILLWSNMDSYLSKYFVNDKLSDLQQIIFNINTSFSEINKGVTKLIPQCS